MTTEVRTDEDGARYVLEGALTPPDLSLRSNEELVAIAPRLGIDLTLP